MTALMSDVMRVMCVMCVVYLMARSKQLHDVPPTSPPAGDKTQ